MGWTWTLGLSDGGLMLTVRQKALCVKWSGLPEWSLNRYRRLVASLYFGDFDEALSVARLALVDAARTYEPAKGQFSTHAVTAIRWKLITAATRGAGRQEWTGDEVYVDNHPGREDDPAEAAAERDAATLTPLMAEEILESIPRRLARLLRMRYLEGLNQSEMALRMGLTKQRIGQLMEKAMRQAREHVAEAGIIWER